MPTTIAGPSKASSQNASDLVRENTPDSIRELLERMRENDGDAIDRLTRYLEPAIRKTIDKHLNSAPSIGSIKNELIQTCVNDSFQKFIEIVDKSRMNLREWPKTRAYLGIVAVNITSKNCQDRNHYELKDEIDGTVDIEARRAAKSDSGYFDIVQALEKLALSQNINGKVAKIILENKLLEQVPASSEYNPFDEIMDLVVEYLPIESKRNRQQKYTLKHRFKEVLRLQIQITEKRSNQA